MPTTIRQEIDGLLDRLDDCRLNAQRELQNAEQHRVAGDPGDWTARAHYARTLVRDCTAEIDCLHDEERRLMPMQRPA